MALLVVAMLACVVMPGCGTLPSLTSAPGGTVRISSIGDDPIQLTNDCTLSMYSDAITTELTFFASDVSYETVMNEPGAPSQVMRLDVLWEPTPGRTPMDKSATNLSIRYVVNTGEEIGIYGGGGFATIAGRDTRAKTVTIRDGLIRLIHATDGFKDILGATHIEGTFTAVYDRRRVERLHYTLSQHVTNALGETVIVQR